MKYIKKDKIGVSLGSLIIICFCLLIISISKGLYNFNNLTPEEKGRHEKFVEIEIFLSYFILGVSVFAIITTALLIAGIVKKNYKLMIPWLCCAVMGIICQCLSVVLQFHLLFAFFPLLGVELLVFYCTYMLYEDIRKAKKESERIALQTNQQNVPNYGHRTSIAKKYIQDGEN